MTRPYSSGADQPPTARPASASEAAPQQGQQGNGDGAAPPAPTARPVLPPHLAQANQAPPQPVRAQPVQPQPVQAQSAQPQSAQPQPVPAAQPQPTGRPAEAARPIPASAAPRPLPAGKGKAAIVRTDDDEPDETTPQAVKSAPPWLVSAVIHMVALLVLGLLYVPQLFDDPVELEVVYAETEGVQLEDDVFETSSLEDVQIEEPVLSEDLNPANDPLAAPPEMDISLDALQSTDSVAAPSVGMALSGREKGAKEALLAAYGGTRTTEEAVKMGLEWLKRNQNRDGSWSLIGPYDGGGQVENRTSATAMALLAFQGAGHTHKAGEFKEQVVKGWKWLLDQQDRDGNFFHEGPHHHRLYTQAQATIALCELYGMTKDETYKEPAQRAIDYAMRVQAPEGGWRYYPRQDSDTSVTGWFVMALQSALMAGLEVQSPVLENIRRFLDSVAQEGGTRYVYQPGKPITTTMTAEALLCRQYLGWKHNDDRLHDGVEYLLAHPVDYDDQDVYYWYYATQVLHHMGGEQWHAWNNVMRQAVPEAQTKTGRERGSWSPAADKWSNYGGRLYTTCLSIYMLEVYYRHLPIYKHNLL